MSAFAFIRFIYSLHITKGKQADRQQIKICRVLILVICELPYKLIKNYLFRNHRQITLKLKLFSQNKPN